MTYLPHVSIITPSYNQGRFLEQTIHSVLAQDYPRIEYIVIDGNSTDGSVEILQRFADRLAYWESSRDQGQADAINKGLIRSKGELLGWLNSDDLLLPGTVRRVVDSFAQNPEVDVIYGRLERIDEDGRLVPTPLLPKDKVVFNKHLVVGECVVNQPGSFWRRRIMDKVGVLDPSLNYAMDYEYWIRMSLAGARFVRLPDVVARFRLSSSSKTVGHTAAMVREQLVVLENLLARPDLPQELGLKPGQIRRMAGKTRGDICLLAFYGYMKIGQWGEARYWLGQALIADPMALFRRRWWDLAIASLVRRTARGWAAHSKS